MMNSQDIVHTEKTIYFVLLCIFLILFIGSSAQGSDCEPNFLCVPIAECNLGETSDILFPCNTVSKLFCCPKTSVNNYTVVRDSITQKKQFPNNCGVITIDNKIIGGEEADPGQFPWMASLGYQRKPLRVISYLCGGSLISNRYVLTAAHCLNNSPDVELVHVRLGENNLQATEACQNLSSTKTCTNKNIDAPVEFHISHPLFNKITLKNDLGLIKLKIPITFTEYILPICLPFEWNYVMKDITGQKLIVSGWGKTDPNKLSGSPTLRYAMVTIWEQHKCENIIPPEVKPLSENQLCANGEKEDSCKGDSGGPLFNLVPMKNTQDIRAFQIGIVSFAPAATCGIQELPSVYTKVDKYLQWITENTK